MKTSELDYLWPIFPHQRETDNTDCCSAKTASHSARMERAKGTDMQGFPLVLETITDLSFSQIEDLLFLSEQFREQPNTVEKFYPLTQSSTLCLIFLENSTRTKLSFDMAAQKLGIRVVDLSPSQSSLAKGEDFLETLRTLAAQGMSQAVIRTSQDGLFSGLKNKSPMGLINGGDGISNHPTQALLDLMTLAQAAGGVKNLKDKSLTIVGDIRHSRVANSLLQLLPQFGMNVRLCGPQEFLPAITEEKLFMHIHDFEEAVKTTDYLYCLRIQKERHGKQIMEPEQYRQNYGLSLTKLQQWNPQLKVFHPGPVNIGVELERDIIESESYWGHQQVSNSVFMRMALLARNLEALKQKHNHDEQQRQQQAAVSQRTPLGRPQNETEFQAWLKQTKVYLHLESGRKFEGYINRPASDPELSEGIWGEAAFTTAMSGYQETMTDPSYLGQHIIFATAHVGNYPANNTVLQSGACHASSVIAKNFSLNDYLLKVDRPLISGVDTRSLIRHMVENPQGHRLLISTSEQTPSSADFKNAPLVCNQLERVSTTEVRPLNPGEQPIVLVDYGVKSAIIQKLKATKLPLIMVGHETSAEEILKYSPRLVFLSNGPGDPRAYQKQVKEVKKLLQANVPIRGICLGHQLLTLALGAEIIRLPYGQRGINHPVLDHYHDEVVITSQNHGYTAEESSLNDVLEKNISERNLYISHRSLFDQSVEGMASWDGFIKSVQFHPEANPGPQDAFGFFAEIEAFLTKGNPETKERALTPLPDLKNSLNRRIEYKKVLIVGSGPIKIGQASEFDYSGTQACKALLSLGVEVVLLNSNPATIMTDPEMSSRTYIEPITPEVVKNIARKEKVDAVLSTLGGQTALNICLELEEENFFQAHDIKLLGANADTIRKTEDRELFAKEMSKLGYQAGKRFHANDPKHALELAESTVGFPLIIRRDFALGGRGAALVHSTSELNALLQATDIKFPVTMEKSLVGHKEIELEVMVDSKQNGVIICSIENVDPCGIHTGDSITVAPAMTISDRCYQNLRTMALRVAKHMGVVAGGANVQFAINPHNEDDIVVIEMNPRVSRSSALASKATGYPIAKISGLLAMGFTLKEILNDITRCSPVSFEPTLDYVAVKVPVFPFNKFPTSSTVLGPQMRSVGEVLALGGSFNEAFLKALRSLELGLELPLLSQLKTTPLDVSENYLRKRMSEPRELSLLTVLEALRVGIARDEIFDITKITPWFIDQMSILANAEKTVQSNQGPLDNAEELRYLKSLGFSDKHLALLMNVSQKEILQFRLDHNIRPVYKAVDTCSGEFKAQTPYFYGTYQNENEPSPLQNGQRAVLVMGSGPNRIGQGIEFDYSCVKACKRLKKHGIRSIMANSNPETVSTDYDSSDRLYIGPLYSEDLFDIFLHERPEGVITSFSGQTGIKVRGHIEKSFRHELYPVNFLGAPLETLDKTENRKLFDQITREVPLAHTTSMEVNGYKKLINACLEIGFPVIIRPSYVIGGESMFIFRSMDDLEQLPPKHLEQLKASATTFQVENYLEDALEYDVDLIRDQYGNTIFTVCEHIEYAGVHSGDSGMISPPVVLTHGLYERMKDISKQLAEKLNVIGPINFQYAVKDENIYCIEANPRGSRTLPFLSKAYDIPLPGLATDAMLGEQIPNWDREVSPYFSVKQSTFPFDRFVQDNIILGPKMRSTGETFGMDQDKDHAILKSYLGNYPNIMGPGKILISLSDQHKNVILPYLKALKNLGMSFLATGGTYNYIKKQGIPCTLVAKVKERAGINMLDVLKDPELKMVFNTPLNQGSSKSEGEIIRNTAIQYGVPCFTRAENIKAVVESLLGSAQKELTPVSLQEAYKLGGML